VAVAISFGVLLYIAVLISQRARTSVLSTAVLFLFAGIALGHTPVLKSDEMGGLLKESAHVALFVILFVDGTQLDYREIKSAWRLPGRALLLGLPLTVLAIAVTGRYVLSLSWFEATLVGIALSPTDPVMVRTILERTSVPIRLRRLLSVESGLNDGIALPPLLILLSLAHMSSTTPTTAILEAVGGLAIGVAGGLLTYAERVSWLSIAPHYRPLLGLSVAVTIYGVCDATHTNELLAAFAAGITFASVRKDLAHAFADVGEPLSEALKLGTLLIFGATLKFDFEMSHLLFAAAALLAARPLALLLAFLGGDLPRKEWLAAAWFGPKGFASLLYGAMLYSAGADRGGTLYHVIGLVVAVSVIAHSSTDWLVARTFSEAECADEA
jgi:NhaP-type Na+/H+ or K+/H+ antiporter